MNQISTKTKSDSYFFSFNAFIEILNRHLQWELGWAIIILAVGILCSQQDSLISHERSPSDLELGDEARHTAIIGDQYVRSVRSKGGRHSEITRQIIPPTIGLAVHRVVRGGYGVDQVLPTNPNSIHTRIAVLHPEFISAAWLDARDVAQ